LACVCRFAEFLTHAPCLKKFEDGLDHCDRKFLQKFEELDAKMEEQDVELTNATSPEMDSEPPAFCW
jgi:hypothetical protein